MALLTQDPHTGGTGTSPTATLDAACPTQSTLDPRPWHLLALPRHPAQPSPAIPRPVQPS